MTLLATFPRTIWFYFVPILFLLFSGSLIASDELREARLVEEIETNLFDGEVISLGSDDEQFAAVEMISEDPPRGGIILLHGRGFHADWPENIGPLRVGRSEAGWQTLSLQLPVLEKTAKYFDYLPVLPEAGPRLDAAIAHLSEQGISPIILLAHSCGAHMAMLWLESSKGKEIDGFVGIGMGATDYKQPMQHPFPFASLDIPVLDIYGENDYPAVHRLAPQRLALMTQGGNARSKQIMLPEADHYFVDHPDEMTAAISSWLGAVTN